MKIFLICSKSFYDNIPPILKALEERGHQIVLPNCYDCPSEEAKFRGTVLHSKWKSSMIKHSEEVISNVDAVLVLNYTKDGIENYLGGATFLEMYDAFRLGKKIYMMNGIPEGILKDEIIGFNPIVIKGDLSKIE